MSRRRLPLESFTYCWYVPGEIAILDLVHPDDGLTLYGSRDADTVRAEHPDARCLTCDEAFAAAEAAARARFVTPVAEITPARFMEALEVLPPVGWTARRGVESFRLSERLCGPITNIYARLGDRCFTLTDDIRLPADEISARVLAFAAAHPKPAPERPVPAPEPASRARPDPGGGQ